MQQEAPFTCGHCGRLVPPLPSGGHHRNHCPYCLYSRHVDERVSGDRASRCGGLMEPIGYFQRRNGEYVLTHRCLVCGAERFNRIAADDDLPLALSLPVLPLRQGDHALRDASATSVTSVTSVSDAKYR
jgi:DNA-directed RNA polymerase subunit RPC12/RpoP